MSNLPFVAGSGIIFQSLAQSLAQGIYGDAITDQRILDYTGDKSLVLQLQGFIFFGSANSLYEKVKAMVTIDGKKMQFVILDMKLVQGIDSSAVKQF